MEKTDLIPALQATAGRLVRRHGDMDIWFYLDGRDEMLKTIVCGIMQFQMDYYYDPGELYRSVMSDYWNIPDQDYVTDAYKPNRREKSKKLYYEVHFVSLKKSDLLSLPDFLALE